MNKFCLVCIPTVTPASGSFWQTGVSVQEGCKDWSFGSEQLSQSQRWDSSRSFGRCVKVLFKPFIIALKYLYISGNKNLHQTLSSATKKSSILNKAVVQRRYPQKQREDRASPDRRDRYPNRYRDRSRSPVKNRGRDRGDKSHNSHYKKKGGGGKNGGKGSRENNSKK